ncbi:hypothetical protein P245_25675 [Comamonas thiooxydans]|uniref:DUF1376 domain-containing protein n=1 Tax=Comamonas thiooxydans TaxID=363952 RepID=A0A0E3BV38_9BURK|nr:YdaU family protein [Comamonas thiooxydans]KGG83025.1 hypothetical protein P245_25675 [Comamonas thiooxydans]
MNYYPFHIGDYLSATRHLSWEEDAAYRRLLDTYYITEKPLPVELRAVCRLVLATTESQREAVEVVLQEFFELTEAGWINRRADAEIATMLDKQEKQRERANKRWKKPAGNAGDDQSGDSANGNGNAGGAAPAMPRHTDSYATASDSDASALPPTPTPTPTPINSSVANATGGEPPKLTDPAEIIFGYGLSMLVNAGTGEKQGRSFLGGLRKAHGDEALIDKLRECAKAKPLQPLEWLAAALPPPVPGRRTTVIPPNRQEALEQRNRNVADAWAAEGA